MTGQYVQLEANDESSVSSLHYQSIWRGYKEGNARRIIIKHEGKTLLEVPLTIGVAGVTALTILAPVLVAIGAIAGLVTQCTLIVEKVEKKE